MAVDLSNISICPQRQAEIIGRTIRHNTILDYFTPHTGYNKGAFTYRFMEAGGNFVDCCEEGAGQMTGSEIDGRTNCFKFENKWCGEALQEALNDFQFQVTAGGESIDGRITDVFAEENIAYVSNLVNKVVVQGDTTSSDANLKRIDGILKQARANGVVIDTPTSTNLYQAIKEGIRRLPVEARQAGEILVFIPLEWGDLLQDRLINENLFHYNPGSTSSINDTYRLPGLANVTVVPNYGFSDNNEILILPRVDLHWFTNIATDYTNLYFGRCECADQWLERIKFILGVLLIRPDWSVVMTISDEILNAPFCIQVCSEAPAADAASAEALHLLSQNMVALTQMIASPAQASGYEMVDELSNADLAALLESKGFSVPAPLKKAIAAEAPAEAPAEVPAEVPAETDKTE